MRTVVSLILASLGAYAFGFVADLLVGVMLRDYPTALFHPFVMWSVVTVCAFPTALAARGPAWTVWLPCAIFACIAARGALAAGTSHSWVVAALVLGQATLTWWAMRPESARTQTFDAE
jgi:hypothetical protein